MDDTTELLKGAAVYGLCLTATMVLLGQLAPQPGGSVVLFGGFTLHSAWSARILWRRTRLPFATAAIGSAVVMFLSNQPERPAGVLRRRQ